MAFRPTITRGLVLSAMLFLAFSNILGAISMPIGIGGLNPLIFKDLFENWDLIKEEIVTFFVSKIII